MAHNNHPCQRAYDARQFMSLDMDSLNPYNFKNMSNGFAIYQIYQTDYYFTCQLKPISLVSLSP